MKKNIFLSGVAMVSLFTLASCGVKTYTCHGLFGKEGVRLYLSSTINVKNSYKDDVKIKVNYAHDSGVDLSGSYGIYYFNSYTGSGLLEECNPAFTTSSYDIKDVKKTYGTESDGREYYTIESEFGTDWDEITITSELYDSVFSREAYRVYLFLAPMGTEVKTTEELTNTYCSTFVTYTYHNSYLKLK